jgi:transposase
MIIGIDVSKSSFDSAWALSGKSHHGVYEYSDKGIAQLLKDTPETAHYVMEATGVYHSKLALTLHEAGRAVTVVNPLVIKRFCQMQLTRVKSDKADAEKIRQYGEQTDLALWKPSADEIDALRQAHGWLDDLIRDRTRLLNRQEAHQHQAKPNNFVTRQMKETYTRLTNQIVLCEGQLSVIVKKCFPELYEHLVSIPSIGKKTAIELIVITEAFSKFAEVKGLSAYTGISPTTYSSGSSIKCKGVIAKMGNGRIRQLLYLCSLTAMRSNKDCKALYERMKVAGKPGKVIQVAIAHKLLRQAFAVATKGVYYAENPA